MINPSGWLHHSACEQIYAVSAGAVPAGAMWGGGYETWAAAGGKALPGGGYQAPPG